MSLLRRAGIRIFKKCGSDEALKLFKVAVEEGDYNAINDMGVLYDKKGIYETAFECYLISAALGNLTAINNVGKMFKFGKHVTRDLNLACAFYRRGISLGYPECYYSLASVYLDTEESDKQQQAVTILKEGLKKEKHFPDLYSCSVQLGYMYEQGIVVKQSYKKAIECYKVAANKGMGHACFNLAMCYLNVNKVKKALVYLHKAADKNYPDAYAKLAAMYYNGDRVKEDTSLANKYLAKARELKSPRGQLHYIELMLNGTLPFSNEDINREWQEFFKNPYYGDYWDTVENLKEGYPDKYDWSQLDEIMNGDEEGGLLFNA